MFIKDLYKTAFLVNTDDRHSSGERRIDLNIYYDNKLDLLRLDHNAGYDKILPAEQFTYHIEPEDHLLDLAGEILAITELKHDSGSISCLSYKDNPLALSLGRFCTSNYAKPDHINIKNLYMHLTNFSLNKNSDNFISPEEEFYKESSHASKRLLTNIYKTL